MTRFRALLCALLLPCALDAQQTTVTPNIGLQLPGYNSTNWQVPVYYDFNKLDSIFGGTQSIPSLHITGNLQVDGTFLGASGGVTNSQVIGAIGFTPLNPASNLSDVTNAPAALLNLGGFPAQIPAAWSSGTTYSKYALVLGSDSNTYISNTTSNTNNNPTAAGSAYWSKFAGGGAAAVGGIGTVQVASNTGGLAAATPANLFAALGYTPLNPANNASDFASPSTALSNLGGATTASVTAAAATANAALPKAGGNMTGSVTFLSGGVNVPFGAFNGGSAEIGSQATSGTGFVDLHSDGSTTDFNVRLQSTGGTPGVAGSGNASILGATLSAPATTVPALTISGVTSAGCGQISASGQVTSTGAPCGTGSATLPASTGPNQALVATSSGSTSYTPTTLATSATTDTTNAANIGSGTLNVARLPLIPVANGGTGTTTPGLIGGTNVTVTGTWPNQTLSATGASLPAATANNQVPVYPTSGSSTTVPTTLTAASVGAVASSAVGAASGVASLDSTTHIPVAQLPTSNIPYASLSGTPTIPNFQTAGSANATQTSLNIAAGSNVTVANSGNTVTISSTVVGAASFTPSAIQFATSSSATRAATTSDINSIIASGHFQSLWQTSKRPRVDLSHSDFGVDGSYATGQNPACTTDNTAAFSAAIAYAVALAATNQSAPVLYIPTGCYNISAGFLLQGSNAGLSISGDGSGNSIINFTGTSGYALKLIGGNLTSQAYGRINLRGFTLQSTGHLTGATLLELQNAQNIDLDDVALKNTGGIALNLVNTERSVFHNLELDGNARSINGVTSSNEDYFFNTHVMSPGQDLSNYVYNGNPNAVSGTVPTSGATIRPNYNAAVTTIAGQNFHMSGGSVKGTVFQGAFKFWGANQYSIEHIYVEAFGNGTQNPDLQVGGASILSTSTSAMTTSTTTTPVNGAIYQPWYVTDQASIANFGSLWAYDIQPPDYTYPGDTTASALGGGITKGSRETVNVAAFYGAGANGAGSVQIANRGINGTTALAWPAGAMFVLPQTANTDMVSRDMHYNGNLGIASGNTLGCSQNTLNASWLHSTTVGAPVGSPATVCAEKLIGPVYDGIAALTPNRGFSPSGTLVQGILAEENDYDFIGADSATQAGDGLDFISLNGTIKLNKYDCGAEQAPVTNEVFPAAGNPVPTFHSYNDGVCKIQFGFYPNDVGTDSYAHAIVNNLVTGATVDAGIRAYNESTTQFQPYGAKTGPNFWGQYTIEDVGGLVEDDWLGIPFTAEHKMSVGGSLNLDLTATQDITNKLLVTSGGIVRTYHAIGGNYSVAVGDGFVSNYNPGGTSAITLPTCGSAVPYGWSTTLIQQSTGTINVISQDKTFFLDGSSYALTYTWPTEGTVSFECEQYGWRNITRLPYLGSVTVAVPGTNALGTSYTAPTASATSSISSSVFSWTEGTAPVATKGTALFNVTFVPGLAYTPKFCALSGMPDSSGGSNAALAALDLYAGNYSASGYTVYVNGTALTASAPYVIGSTCQLNN